MARQIKILVVPAEIDTIGKITVANTVVTLDDATFAKLSPTSFTGATPVLQDMGYVGPAGAVTTQATFVAQPAALVTTQTAGTTYVAGTTDVMINNLKTDVTNLQATLSTVMTNLKASGAAMKAS